MSAVSIAEAWPAAGKPFTVPELITFELRDGRYAEAAHVSGDTALRAVRPFPVEVIPARLAAGLRTAS